MYLKRIFDIVFSLAGLIIFAPIILICLVIAFVETKSSGLYAQLRVGRGGKLFTIYKIKTMFDITDNNDTITQFNDPRITKSGNIFRLFKLDELPQLWNVLIGDMSFVGPRPDVPGYADLLDSNIKILLLSVRPGITGPATLKYRNEEYILAMKEDPKKYNDEIIYPDKVKINIEYIKNQSLFLDICLIIKTII